MADLPPSPAASRLPAFFRRCWPYLFTSLAPLVLYAPFLLGWRVLYWGTPLLQFYPWRKYAFDTLLSGHWPLWNPYLGNGAPLIANLQSAILYPPNWLSLILPLDYSMGWLVVLHWAWAGAGMVALARALGLKPVGQAVAGLAFGLSQYLVARAWFFSINATVAWVPWVIWAAERCLGHLAQRSPHARRYAWLLAFFLAMQFLAGHAQTAWYTLLLLGAWVGWRYFTYFARPGVRPLVAAGAHFLPAILGAAGLAALQLFPTAELLRQSPRASAAAYDFVMTYSFWPWRLLTLLAPDLLGNPARGQFLGYGNYWEDAIYVGVLPLLWALAAVVRAVASWRSPANKGAPAVRHLVPLLVLILGVTVPLALGGNTPVFPFFYRYVPTFALFQAPARMMLWLEFALALLAGLGASQWQPPPRWARWWLNISAAGAVSVAFTGAGLLVTVPAATGLGPQYHTLARAFTVLGVSLFICIVLLLWQPPEAAPAADRKRWARLLRPAPLVWELCVALFVAADLIFAGAGLSPGAPPDLYHTPTISGPALRQALGGHRLLQYAGDEYQVFTLLHSFKSFGDPQEAYTMREVQLTDATLLEGISTVNNYEPLVSARFEDFVAVISATQSLNLLHLADVGVLASSTPLDWEQVTQGGPTGFYRVPGQSRRVRVVYSAQRVPDETSALYALAAPDFDPETTVILEPDNSTPAETFPPFPWNASPAGVQTLISNSPSPYTIWVSLDQTGWVVISDTCYPGWVAFVDGKPAPLRCADLTFRAVLAPPGEHVIEFRYQPRSWAWGLLVSGLSWLLWLALGLVFWLGGRARRPG